MANIKLDAFNPALYVNHIPEIKIAANKKNMELIILVGGLIILGLITDYLIERYLEESERLASPIKR